MEPNQQNINTLSYSFSSSSSGNLQNNSKKSEKMISKKSILRKEGTASKNKDKHPVFVEPLNQVAFYIPDIHNQNKNHRISLNTVTEEQENSHSGSDLMNNLSSNKISINSEKVIYDNDNDNVNNTKIENFTYNVNTNINSNNYDYNNININNNNNNQYTNINQYDQFNNINQQDISINNQYNQQINNVNQQNNNIINNDENKTIENIDIKRKNRKKPPIRKTLESDYYLKELNQNDDINNYHPIQNNQNSKNEIIEKKENQSKIINLIGKTEIKVRLSTDSNISSQNNNNSIINTNQNNQQNNISNNSTNEKIEEQTKINTEVNKQLFNIKNYNTNLNINSSIIPPSTNDMVDNNKINNNKNQINNNNSINDNNIIPKKIKKPNFKKRITIGIGNNDGLDLLIDNNNIIKNNDNDSNNNNINNANEVNIVSNFNNNINNPNNLNVNNNLKEVNISSNINNNSTNFLYDNNNLNKLNNNINNKIVIQNNVKNNNKKKERKAPKMNTRRITMAINSLDSENLFSDDIIIENPQEAEQKGKINNNINNLNYNNNIGQKNKLNIYKDYNNIFNEEPIYVEPKIIAQEKDINYTNYEKYLKFNTINHSLSEKKYNFATDNIDSIQNKNLTVKKDQINDTFHFNNYNKDKLSLESTPLIELIYDKIKKHNQNIPKREKYSLMLLKNDIFDIEKEINKQINFIEKNLEEKEKYWTEKSIKTAQRRLEYESEISNNKNELNNINNKTNEINNKINDILNNDIKYDRLSEKAKKIKENLLEKGIGIKDIEHITYKEMNCLLFTIMIQNNIIYKFIISDNLWYEKNISGGTLITFLGVLYSEIFGVNFCEEAIMIRDKNINILIQKYFNETIKKVFPNEYEQISINKLSHKYKLSIQISICFFHILKMINFISLIDEDVYFNTQDLKKYSVKFSYITIYGAKINFEYIFDIENPFSGNYLNFLEVEKNDYILDDFNEYRKNKINIIWKYFNPKDIQINEKFFDHLSSMLYYIDDSDVSKKEINDEYIFNVMQGNSLPNDDDNFSDDEKKNFDSLELFKQLTIIYGKDFINRNMKNNQDTFLDNNNNLDNDNKENINNNSRDNDNEEIILHVPSSKEDDENDKDLNNIIDGSNI